MSTSPGTRLGPYEILAPLGAGGMGEVYRAWDTRLDREVAIKVLPERLAADAKALSRFEREAKAVAALSHPNILAIHDFGEDQGVRFAVTELLEGETLRERLNQGVLAPRKAIEFAVQIANGLAAAHEKGIVHRDLKPENVFITKEGRVKILDFGLAKLTEPQEAGPVRTQTVTPPAETDTGVVLGTAGYMSPEQVQGLAADRRSDIFAFGAVLYEMLSGHRAFKGASTIETLHAILKDDPPQIGSETNVSPALERVVRRCLEKGQDERFQSARDVGFTLEALSGGRETKTLKGPSTEPSPFPSFQRLTFRHGHIESALFTPDGNTIVFSARWGVDPVDVFMTRPGSAEARSLGLSDAVLLSISRSGEMLVRRANGTLARVALAGGVPRDVVENINSASWAPNGRDIAIVRSADGKSHLEFPIGKILYETGGSLSHPRVSPDASFVSILEHPARGWSQGWLAIVDVSGAVRRLSEQLISIDGAVWSASGDEIWFSAVVESQNQVYAVTPTGKRRLVTRGAGNLEIHDVSSDQRVLAAQARYRIVMRGRASDAPTERELSWLNGSTPMDISAGGETLLFREFVGEGGPLTFATYIRGMNGSSAVRLGDGDPMALSPDGKWALSVLREPLPAQLILLPTGSGQPRILTRDDIHHQAAVLFPDGQRVLFGGREPGSRVRLYVQDLGGGPPCPLPFEFERLLFFPRPISPDCKRILLRSERGMLVFTIDDGAVRPIVGVSDQELPLHWGPDGQGIEDHPLQWGSDGTSILVRENWEGPARIVRVDLETGQRTLWKEIAAPTPTGAPGRIVLSPDGNSYAYSYDESFSDLYLIEGLQ